MSTNQPNTQSNSDPQQPNEPAITPLPIVSSSNQPVSQNPLQINQNIITNQNNDQQEKQIEQQEGKGQGQGQGEEEEAQGGQVNQNEHPDIEDEGQQQDEEYSEQQVEEEQHMQAQGDDHQNDPDHQVQEQKHVQQQDQDKENDQNKGKGGENEGNKMQHQNIDKKVHQQHEQKRSQMIDEGHSVLKSPQKNTPNIQQQKNPELAKKPQQNSIPKPDHPSQQSHQAQQTQVHPTNITHTTHTTHPQPHKQSYLNHLQCQLRLKQSESWTQSQQIKQQKINIYNLQQQVKILRKNNLDREKQGKEFQKLRRQMEGQGMRLEARVQELEEELGKYRQIGDVRVMQARISQLQAMIQIQKQQISTITQSTPTTPPQQSLNPHQFLQKLSSLQQALQQKQSKLKIIQIKHQNLLSEHNENLSILQNMDNKLKQNIQQINQLQSLLEKERQMGRELREKVVGLEGKMGGENQEEEREGKRDGKREEERWRDMENQKDIVFREYIKMEANFKNLEESQRDLKAKYHQACRELRTTKKQMIPKKDYQQLYQKYKKTKTCLQKSLSNPSNPPNSTPTSHPLPQTPPYIPTPHLDSLSTHLQQCHTYLSKSSELLIQQQIQNYKIKDKKNQKIINQLLDKNQRLLKINLLYERQIQYKGEIIDRLVLDGQRAKEEERKWKEEKGRIMEGVLGDVGGKWRLARVEAKAANLLIRNRKILTQKDNWKNLYEQLKSKFDQFISRNPTNQPQTSNIQSSQPQLQPSQPQSTPLPPQHHQPPPPTHQSETQTQGLNQLYYKQIKQTLSTLKRIPQLIKTTTNNYEKVGKQLQEYKKKYEQTNEKYNIKFKQLIAQRSQNDIWREKERKNIFNQFQDLRDIVDGDRLMSCLRKAKNLIQYLEGGNQEEGEIVGE